MIKIAFFDVDGTLLPFGEHKISKNTFDCLKRLQEKGIKICLATGRGPFSLPKIEGIEFDSYLTFNGSYCFNKKKEIFANKLSNEDAKIITENANALGLPVAIAATNYVIANGKDQALIDYFKFANLQLKVVDNFSEYLNKDVFQLMIGCRQEHYDKIMTGSKNAKIVAWWSEAADIIPAVGGKGLGIQKILEFYNFKKEEALAFGDGNNDIDMFKAVGQSVAMGNASSDLKEIATDICLDCKEDGIYHYCLEKKLI